MRKVTRILALALLMLLLMLPFTAHAEGGLTASATIVPEALSEAGKINIKLKLTNTSDTMLEDVNMMARGINETLGNFDPNSTRSFTISNYKILEEELGGYITFTFVWYENGEVKTLHYNVDIPIKTAEPGLTAERTVSANSGKTGDVVTITYALQNTGETDLYSVTIEDAAVGEIIEVGDMLLGGEVVRLTREVTLADANVITSPVITAQAMGGTPLIVELDPVEIMLTDARLELAVEVGTPAADGTPIIITVKNPGNVDFDSVALIDENGSALTSAFGLAMGDTKQITADVVVSDPRELTVTATATFGANQPLIVTSSPVTLAPYISASDIVVTLIAKPVKSEFDEPAEVAFAIRVDNDSPVELYDLDIIEETEGKLTSISTVEQGPQTVNVKILVTETREMKFYATFQDEHGNAYRSDASPITITVNEARPTNDANTPGVVENNGGDWLKWVLLIIAVLLLAAAASLIYMLAQNKRRRQQEREADELDKLLAARQEKHRTERIAKLTDADAERRAAASRPRMDDLTIGDIPTNHPRRAQSAPAQPPEERPVTQKKPVETDDLFEDEFK